MEVFFLSIKIFLQGNMGWISLHIGQIFKEIQYEFVLSFYQNFVFNFHNSRSLYENVDSWNKPVTLLIYQTDYLLYKISSVAPIWFRNYLWEHFDGNASNLLWSLVGK